MAIHDCAELHGIDLDLRTALSAINTNVAPTLDDIRMMDATFFCKFEGASCISLRSTRYYELDTRALRTLQQIHNVDLGQLGVEKNAY